jgi:hypothetical protein
MTTTTTLPDPADRVTAVRQDAIGAGRVGLCLDAVLRSRILEENEVRQARLDRKE